MSDDERPPNTVEELADAARVCAKVAAEVAINYQDDPAALTAAAALLSSATEAYCRISELGFRISDAVEKASKRR